MLFAGVISCKKEPIVVSNAEVRDPSMILANGKYYLFGTGTGIQEWSSTDMVTWQQESQVFATTPDWVSTGFPDNNNDIWAPDISYNGGLYYLFYTVSQYGTPHSAIGYATNVTLNRADSTYKWVDHGQLIQSPIAGYNAIDPNFVTDYSGNPYVVFGSFYNGITISKFRNDSARLNTVSFAEQPLLARRSADVISSSVNAIEAPFIFKHNGYYYLFASIGSCCAGVNSTYSTIMGRSSTIDSGYYDKEGLLLANGGGTTILQGNKFWHAAGGESVYNFNGTDYIIYFSYDNSGTQRLRVAKINWDTNNWPVIQSLQ